MNLMKPIHPGEILMEDFFLFLEMSQYYLSKNIDVPAIRISEIVNGKRSITADTALRLSSFFKNSAEFWLNLQNYYDLEIVKDKIKEKLLTIRPYQG